MCKFSFSKGYIFCEYQVSDFYFKHATTTQSDRLTCHLSGENANRAHIIKRRKN